MKGRGGDAATSSSSWAAASSWAVWTIEVRVWTGWPMTEELSVDVRGATGAVVTWVEVATW